MPGHAAGQVQQVYAAGHMQCAVCNTSSAVQAVQGDAARHAQHAVCSTPPAACPCAGTWARHMQKALRSRRRRSMACAAFDVLRPMRHTHRRQQAPAPGFWPYAMAPGVRRPLRALCRCPSEEATSRVKNCATRCFVEHASRCEPVATWAGWVTCKPLTRDYLRTTFCRLVAAAWNV